MDDQVSTSTQTAATLPAWETPELVKADVAESTLAGVGSVNDGGALS